MTFKRNSLARQGGFTLVEVLIALVIFGVIAASVLRTMQSSVQRQRVMEERLAANWVAQQVLSQIRVQTPWPPIGEKKEEMSFAERDWEVTAKVEATSEERLRHIVIQVGYPDAENPTLTLDAWAAQE
ncbi:type II secretion system minor pseudopilin GspI [Microbulbifer variabilis]|jgi:general secretion pathway protein I|uniref:Type II secretion system protein I n=1 Tax=Microbulbifer variabilis TaxID=266805 RepID=A0ABY4VGQ9_9GAMM|nr:type II secretion system minor pseudopilin GspI [Microbulbifer variabilis]USD23501.1 type II secretion system minor pseudopilin GspI [Microbulbifer variabilis]